MVKFSPVGKCPALICYYNHSDMTCHSKNRQNCVVFELCWLFPFWKPDTVSLETWLKQCYMSATFFNKIATEQHISNFPRYQIHKWFGLLAPHSSKRQLPSSSKTPIQGVKRRGYQHKREDDRIKKKLFQLVPLRINMKSIFVCLCSKTWKKYIKRFHFFQA